MEWKEYSYVLSQHNFRLNYYSFKFSCCSNTQFLITCILKVALPFLYLHTISLTVVGNKLDGPMLSTILRCLEKHFAPELALEYLEKLILLPRFNIAGSFLESSEKQGNPDQLILNTCCAGTFQFTWVSFMFF